MSWAGGAAGLMAAERAAQAQVFDGDAMPGDSQRVRHDVRRFAGMLGGALHGHAAGFIEPRDGALHLQIEVLLATDCGARVAALQRRGAAEEGLGVDGVSAVDDRGEGLAVDITVPGKSGSSRRLTPQSPSPGKLDVCAAATALISPRRRFDTL